MVVIIDDEKTLISAYIEELESKVKIDPRFKPKHFFYATDALIFIKAEAPKVDVIVIDIGMDFGDNNLMPSEPGGIKLYHELRSSDILKKIPIIFLTIYDKQQVGLVKDIDLENDPLLVYIRRNQPDRNAMFWNSINKAIKVGRFK